MAENIQLSVGSAGDILAADEIGGINFQRVKLIHGADGTNDGDVATDNPFPVDQREIGGIAVPVDNAAFVDGTTPVTPVGYIFDEVAGTVLTENDVAAARINANRAQVVVIEGATRGTRAAVGANGLEVDVQASALPSGAATSGGQLAAGHTVTQAGAPWEVDGNKTSDGAVPGTDNIGTIPAIATAAAPSYTEGRMVGLSVLLNGSLRTEVLASALPSGAATSGGQLADGHSVVTQSNASVNVAQTLGSAISVTNPLFVRIGDGTVNIPFPTALVSGRLNVDVGGSVLPSGAATSGGQLAAGHTVDQTGGPWQVDGPGAHDATVVGNPNILGAPTEDIADAAPANRVLTEGNVGRLTQNGDGALFVMPYGPQQWSSHENSSSTQTDTTVHAAPGAGLSLYVTDIVYSTNAATADNIIFEEAAVTVLGPYALEAVAGRGVAIHFGVPKKITANTALTFSTTQAIAHAVDVMGFIAPG